jgi:hypothetical protein
MPLPLFRLFGTKADLRLSKTYLSGDKLPGKLEKSFLIFDSYFEQFLGKEEKIVLTFKYIRLKSFLLGTIHQNYLQVVQCLIQF